MSLTLYSQPGSPAVRGTLLTIEALGFKDKVKLIDVNIPKLEQLSPEFLKIGSPAVRVTLLTIGAIGLKDKVKLIDVNINKLEQLSQEFLKKNPTHTVPVLEDGNFVLWDSHAINAYLVSKYSANDALYPRDPQKRALVDSMNHFDTGYLFSRAVKIIRAVFTLDKSANLDQLKKDVVEVYDILELILAKRNYVAGEEMTIADFSIVATLSTAEVYVPLDAEKHANILSWYEKMKQLPYYEVNQKGVDGFRIFFKHMASKL